MKAAQLIKHSTDFSKAFAIIELPNFTACQPNEVILNTHTFGLNFADVMATKGMYPDCPPLPAVIGYEAVGTVVQVGSAVTHLQVGDYALAFTRFGGYATQVKAAASGVVQLPPNFDAAQATALATQYCTAYYAAHEAIKLRKGEKVLIHAGAGGVGIALIQLALHAGCEVYSTAGSGAKVEFLKQQGVHHAINYTTQDFVAEIQKNSDTQKVDVVFDAVGGSNFKKGFKLLQGGGRMVAYGAADLSNVNILKKAQKALEFGIYHPVQFMTNSVALIGVNMLRIADQKPEILQHCLEQCVQLTQQGILKPFVGGTFPITQLHNALEALANRQTMGKIAVQW